MLDALNDAGFEVISDCRRGECGVCAIDLVAGDGEVDHRDVFFSEHQKREGRKICPCVSRARGTITVDMLPGPTRSEAARRNDTPPAQPAVALFAIDPAGCPRYLFLPSLLSVGEVKRGVRERQ
jgi:ferredoxin